MTDSCLPIPFLDREKIIALRKSGLRPRLIHIELGGLYTAEQIHYLFVKCQKNGMKFPPCPTGRIDKNTPLPYFYRKQRAGSTGRRLTREAMDKQILSLAKHLRPRLIFEKLGGQVKMDRITHVLWRYRKNQPLPRFKSGRLSGDLYHLPRVHREYRDY